jgi:hypothetical protein
MPKVIVYKGTVEVRGASHSDYDTPIFLVEKNVYGETLGSLMEAMVQSSIELSREVKDFIGTLGEGYDMANDYWYFSASYPDPLRDHQVGADEDYGSGGAIRTADEAVYSMVHYRQMMFSGAIRDLHRADQMHNRTGAWDEYDKRMEHEGTVEDLITSGFSGEEFDHLYNLALHDGTLDFHRKQVLERRERSTRAQRLRRIQAEKEKKTQKQSFRKKFKFFV